ncbi:unnamed protein product [Larinioides sclopetarius]|uniref:Uncharacterized protein n=1 Tax=Larinioides sclopetarius TaxID=280406 RepID=A0AAV2AJL8_9ARAC
MFVFLSMLYPPPKGKKPETRCSKLFITRSTKTASNPYQYAMGRKEANLAKSPEKNLHSFPREVIVAQYTPATLLEKKFRQLLEKRQTDMLSLKKLRSGGRGGSSLPPSRAGDE